MSDPCYAVISTLEDHPSRLNKEAIVLAQAEAEQLRQSVSFQKIVYDDDWYVGTLPHYLHVHVTYTYTGAVIVHM